MVASGISRTGSKARRPINGKFFVGLSATSLDTAVRNRRYPPRGRREFSTSTAQTRALTGAVFFDKKEAPASGKHTRRDTDIVGSLLLIARLRLLISDRRLQISFFHLCDLHHTCLTLEQPRFVLCRSDLDLITAAKLSAGLQR